MHTYKSKSEELVVSIGPGIRKESYVFTDSELKQKAHLDWGSFIQKLPNGKTSIDILGYNLEQLSGSGVHENNIGTSPADTAKSPDYFSHYQSVRESKTDQIFATILGMKNED